MAPTSTGSGSTRSPSGPATRSRSASSVSCSMPVSPRDRQRPTQGVNPSASPRRMTIGAVLAALAPDFPDVTISKIRFLEAEGLITPERTSSGYRTFSPDDLERLRYILTAQRDLFWPLKVIAEALDKLDRGLLPALGDVSTSRTIRLRRFWRSASPCTPHWSRTR